MSDNSISTFKNSLNSKLHAPNKFKVDITSPAGDFTAEPLDVVFPGRSIKTQEEFLWGVPREIPIQRDYSGGDVVITFPVFEDFAVRTYFEKWMDKIFNKMTKTLGGGIGGGLMNLIGGFYNSLPDATADYAEYALNSSVVISALDGAGKPTASITLAEPYPQQLLPLTFSHASQNDYTKLQVKINYRQYIYAG